ncbi:MAG TPA: efflux transporter outer membrane subunit [Bryobacteraceae bacterium]|nr:efflux transporter outer membrane subunit [Bryobacteraceae bacterium]
MTSRLLRNPHKTAAVSSPPPKEPASCFVVWRRASAPFALLLPLACMFLLAGCMVGPKYKQPAASVPPIYKELQESDQWKIAHPNAEALRSKWWEIFGDPQLNNLEDQVTVFNQNMKTAEARFRQARATVRYNRAAEFPTISVSPGVRDLRLSPNQAYFPSAGIGISSATDFLLPFDLSYEVDLWGRIRRTVGSAREEAQASAGDLATMTLSLQAELAYDYFELRSADVQKKLLDNTVKAYADMLQLTTDLFSGGAAPESDVVQARTQLDTTRVQDTDIEVLRAQYEHAIAILIGKPPAEFAIAPQSRPFEPPTIPVGLPSQLLERRPDIAATERRVAEANEGIGIARAAYFPSLVIGGDVGLESQHISNLFSLPSRFWAAGPNASETIFDGGRRRAGTQQARANYDATVATYRETMLEAFQQVEDNLAALRILAQEVNQEKQAVEEAQHDIKLFSDLYEGGADPYLQVVTAETVELLNERNEIDIQRRQMDTSVLLIKALGGGWNVSQLPQMSSLH